MEKNKIKILSILLVTLTIISIGVNAYAHPGNTDSRGGHKDNKNKSGLGSYHYHCGGHPAHLHTNGVCPYASSSSSSKSSTSNSSTLSTKKIPTEPANVAETAIQINENIESIDVGKSKTLTATISPTNATNKNITWKSSDESIATVSTTGEVYAKKCGVVDITAISSNGKTSTKKINITELPKTENSTIIKTSTTNQSNITNKNITKHKEDSNPLGGIFALGLLGGGSYLGYKKYKKS